MDRQPTALVIPQSVPASAGAVVRPAAPKASFASRIFGYDIFLSFALGPPPRGTHSYASDLARRLRERDFTVFFSEDEAPPGEQLDSTLRNALHRSKTLVVIANRGTLERPGWVQKEVEEFKHRHPTRPVIPISMGGALQDPQLASNAQQWLGYQGKIWLDEFAQAIENGIATETLVDRLATAPARARSNVKWRWAVGGVIAMLVALAIGLGFATKSANDNAKRANDSADRARAELRRAVSIRMIVEAQGMISGERSGGSERALLQLLAAQRILSGPEADGGLLGGVLAFGVLRKLFVATGPLNAVAISADGRRIVSGSRDKALQLWDAQTGQQIGVPLQGHRDQVVSVAFSPDGTRIISGSHDKTVRLWDAETGRPIGTPLEGHQDGVLSVAFSPDGAHIVSGSRDGTVRVWDANTGQPIGTPLQGHKGWVWSVSFTPDGGRIVSSDDGTMRLWDAKTGRPIGAPLKGNQKGVMSVAFNPDGTRIVSGGVDGTVQVWDANTGQPYDTPLERHQKVVTSVAFSPDGRRIVSGSWDKTVRMWDANTDQPFGALLKGHQDGVTSVAFSPDGRRIVSGSNDGTVRLWDANTGSPIGAPQEGHQSSVFSVAFSPDDMRIVSGGHDKMVHLWPAPKSWPDELCKKLTRNMSHKEWREWVSPEIDYIVQCPGLPIPPDEPDNIKEKL